MLWRRIAKPDGRRWRRPAWPPERYIWFAPSYVLIHWETHRKDAAGNVYNVEKWRPPQADRLADDWAPVPVSEQRSKT